MAEILEFDTLHNYSLFEEGISIQLVLQSGKLFVDADAKIDTGSTYCIFARHLGEGLELEIENGIPIEIGTVTGSFPAYGHEIKLLFLGIETVSTVYFAESEYFDRNVLEAV